VKSLSPETEADVELARGRVVVPLRIEQRYVVPVVEQVLNPARQCNLFGNRNTFFECEDGMGRLFAIGRFR
jgi:hypothetical protein